MSKFNISIPANVSIDVLGGGQSIVMSVVSNVLHSPLVVLKAGIKGDSGDSNYKHTQASASILWTINHNLGKYPSIQLLTVGGVEFMGRIAHVSLNQATVTLSTATAGVAQCN